MCNLDNNQHMCLDEWSGRCFRSDIPTMKLAVSTLLNEVVLDDRPYILLNDFYTLVGLPNLSIGDDLGWKNNDLLITRNFGLTFNGVILPNGTPAISVGFTATPSYIDS